MQWQAWKEDPEILYVQSSDSLKDADLYSWHEQAMVKSTAGSKSTSSSSRVVAAVESFDADFSVMSRDGALPFSTYQDLR